MFKSRNRLVICALIFAVTISSDSSFAKNHYPDPVFLSRSEFEVAKLLRPAPKHGSNQDQKDFAEIHYFQKTRTKEDCKRAAAVVDVSLATLFGPPYGPLYQGQVDAWAEFFEKVRIDTDYFVQESKKHWARLRPYFNDVSVNPCVHREVTKAYPSGHAAIARVFARLLSQIDPGKKEQFEARAKQIGQDRVLAGVHHPSDIEAGIQLGDKVFRALLKHPEVKKFLAKQKL